ncbi:MAG: polysaccharide deacetylase family protein [Planctomycetes bacterium]|nr:polysaccharide deacetylase family protein [Planctomycetota bacterium]
MIAWKPLLRDVAARTLAQVGATRPDPDALTVVTFHRVLPPEQRDAYPLPGLVVTPDELGRFLAFFAERYTCDTLDATTARWRAGERPARPFLAVTFDDGQLDNRLHAAPLLERAGVRATFFVPCAAVDDGGALWHDRLGFAALAALATDPRALDALPGADLPDDGADAARRVRRLVLRAKEVDDARRDAWIEALEQALGGPARPAWDGMMTWDDLRALSAAGHEIGSHSVTHPLLPRCDDARLADEVAGSRDVLERRLDAPVRSFCYPNGDRDARTREAVAEAGYAQAVTTRPGRNRPGADPFDLRRFDLQGAHVASRRGTFSDARLLWRLSGRQPGVR